MARIVGYQGFEMWGNKVWYGHVTSYSSNHVTISDGVRSATYKGIFTFDSASNVSGTLTGFSGSYNNKLVVSASGFSMNASTAQTLVNSNNTDALVKLICSGADTIVGSGARDKLAGFSGNDTIHGNGGNDLIFGGLGVDKLFGGAGHDWLVGQQGADLLYGGTGVDGVSYYDAKFGLKVDLQFSYRNTGVARGDKYFSIEKLEGTRKSDTLSATSGKNYLWGLEGNDTMHGRGGGDRLYGGKGDDRVFAGFGDDRVYGGDGNDTVFGGAGKDVIFGGNGNDRLSGGTGNDQLTGGLGSDRFVFQKGSGHDRITDFKDGVDKIVFQAKGSSFTYSHRQDGAAALIEFGNNTIRLENFSASDLDSGDFILTFS